MNEKKRNFVGSKMMCDEILYIIVPCFNEQSVLPASHARLNALLAGLVSRGTVSSASRLLYVDDGSTDDTWRMIEDFASRDNVCGLRLSANAGQQNAILAGLELARGRADMLVSVDADLQDDIGVICQMIDKCRAGCDIVLGVRRDRSSDTWFKRTSASVFYALMRRLGVATPAHHAEFRLMTSRAVAELLRYSERNLYLRGVVSLLGFETATVAYERTSRLAGKSKYPLRAMTGLGVDAITSFSIKPVRMVLKMGLLFIFIALAILCYVLLAVFTGRAVSGWASVILSLWLIGGCVLIGLGVVGEYVGKIYTEVKQRPRFHVGQTIIK